MTETEATYVEVETVNEFIAPEFKKGSRAKALRIDLAEVEHLAEIGMKPAAIGPCLTAPVSVHAFRRQFEGKRLVREAYERGNARWQKTVLERMASGKHGVIADIFALKQSHGANWSDHVVTTQDNERGKEAQKVFAERQKKVTALPPGPVKLIDQSKVTDADCNPASN